MRIGIPVFMPQKLPFGPPCPLSCTHISPESQAPGTDQQASRPDDGQWNNTAEKKRRGGTSECQEKFSWGQSERSPAAGRPNSRGRSPSHSILHFRIPIHPAESLLYHLIKPHIHPLGPCVTQFFQNSGQELRIWKAVTLALCFCEKAEGLLR